MKLAKELNKTQEKTDQWCHFLPNSLLKQTSIMTRYWHKREGIAPSFREKKKKKKDKKKLDVAKMLSGMKCLCQHSTASFITFTKKTWSHQEMKSTDRKLATGGPSVLATLKRKASSDQADLKIHPDKNLQFRNAYLYKNLPTYRPTKMDLLSWPLLKGKQVQTKQTSRYIQTKTCNSETLTCIRICQLTGQLRWTFCPGHS